MSEMTFDKMAQQMSPEIYHNLRRAVELRKWPDGRMLSREQLALCLEAMIKYEREHQVPEQQRTGYLDRTKHRDDERGGEPEAERIKWRE
ncbi:YeaC family protein [Halotalea alkalilenta]|uniref:PA-phosphatase n=1 Tax=Halotalea alkalilenta TaxID=376489 RepID=A0A172YGP6_9GAMM|nr:DUF1315 family protein [Halotalea alkalilenta]ANF58286.1 hypothetical protein A5892_13070 [Halotalea alkalilenta]